MSATRKRLCYLAAVIAPCLLTTFGPAQADEQFTATKIVQIPGKPLASFDIGYVDAAINTYVLADRSNAAVDVVNTRSNAFIRQLTGCGGNVALPTCSVFAGPITSPANSAGPNGVIIVDHKEVWAGDGVPPGSTSKVHVINLRNNHLIASVDTGGHFRADELCEDTRRELVLIANDDPADSFLTFISSESHAIVGKIKLDGTDSNGKNIKANGIEQCQNSARNGKFYLAVPDVGGGTNGVNGSTGHDGAVLVISATKPFKVERVFPVAASTGCLGPQGLQFGPNHEIQLGCGGANSVIIDDRNGAIVAIEVNEGGADEVSYNPGNNHFFIARSAAGALGVEDAGRLGTPDADAPTAVGSHSVASDPVRNQTYVPIRAAGSSTVCASGNFGGNNANGCIAIYTAPSDKDDCLAEGEPVLAMNGNEPVFLHVKCRDHDDDRDHDHDHDD
jgi:hypothetical protein